MHRRPGSNKFVIPLKYDKELPYSAAGPRTARIVVVPGQSYACRSDIQPCLERVLGKHPTGLSADLVAGRQGSRVFDDVYYLSPTWPQYPSCHSILYGQGFGGIVLDQHPEACPHTISIVLYQEGCRTLESVWPSPAECSASEMV